MGIAELMHDWGEEAYAWSINAISHFEPEGEPIDLCALLDGYDPDPALVLTEPDIPQLAHIFRMPNGLEEWLAQSCIDMYADLDGSGGIRLIRATNG